MMKKIHILFICSLIGILVSGCVSSSSKKPGPETASAPAAPSLAAGASLIQVEKLPVHTQAALAAILHKLRKENVKVPGVTFDSSGSHDIGGPYTDLSGYKVEVMEIDFEQIIPADKKTNAVLLRGVFTFMNDIGQSLSEQFFIDYQVSSSGNVTINNSATIPIYTDTPTIVGFFIKHSKLASAVTHLKNFRDFYLFAAANNFSMHASQQECAAKSRYDNLSFFQKLKNTDLLPEPVEEEFAFLAFCMDRTSPLGGMTLKISNSVDGSEVTEPEPEYLLFDDGFTIGLVQGKGKFFDPNTPFYVQALYAKGDNMSDSVKVALFSNQKFFGPISALDVPPGGEWITEKISSAGQSKVKPISRFLDPKNREDARLIQEALKKKGFYTGKIDGLFGKGSLASLKAFRKAAMDEDAAQWDMKTQQMLFQ